MIDDIQFLRRRNASQEEFFFHTFMRCWKVSAGHPHL